jgi:hypothetical protein
MERLAQHSPARRGRSSGPLRCRRKFLDYFPKGFRDPDYQETERDYKVATHQRWVFYVVVGVLL